MFRRVVWCAARGHRLFLHVDEVCHPAGDSLGGELWSKDAYALVREHWKMMISDTLLRSIIHADVVHVLEDDCGRQGSLQVIYKDVY